MQIYADCVDVDKREEIGVRPILNILRAMNRQVESINSIQKYMGGPFTNDVGREGGVTQSLT